MTAAVAICKNPKYVPWLNDILFSMNSAFLIVLTTTSTANGPRLLRLPLFVLNGHHQDVLTGTDSYFQFQLAFLIWCCLLTALGLVLVRLTARILLIRTILLPVMDLVAVAGFPVSTMYVFGGTISVGHDAWLQIELASLSLCSLFYLYRGLPARWFFIACLLPLHFGLWFYMTRSVTQWSAVGVTLGLCSAVVLAFSVRLSVNGQPNSAAERPREAN